MDIKMATETNTQSYDEFCFQKIGNRETTLYKKINLYTTIIAPSTTICHVLRKEKKFSQHNLVRYSSIFLLISINHQPEL